MGKVFSNLESNIVAAGILSQAEYDVLSSTLTDFLSKYLDFDKNDKKVQGTFILDGQKDGEKPVCLLRCNGKDGTYRRHFFRTYERSSNEMAADSIDEILSWPTKSRFERFLDPKVPKVSTGIYEDGELSVMVLNTDAGRFLCSMKLQIDDKDASYLAYVIYHWLTRILVHLRSFDRMLQHSVMLLISDSMLLPEEDRSVLEGLSLSNLHLDLLLFIKDDRVYDKWYSWKQEAKRSGKLGLYFE